LIVSLWRRPLYFRNTVFLSAGALIPVVVGLFYALGLTPLRGFDWTPVSFIFTAPIYYWAASRGRLLEIAPPARNYLIEHIEQAVIALNERDIITDFNRAAQAALGISPALIGAPLSSLPPPWADAFARYAPLSMEEALRSGLEALDHPPPARAPFRTTGFDLGPSLIGSLDNVEEVLSRIEGEAHR
jgi:PAS domain-containing protein